MTYAQTTRTAVIDVQGLSHTYVAKGVTHQAIADVSFTVSPGELVSIVGPSGTGKSTLLQCIAGLLKPTSGEISVLGAPVREVPRDLSIVFQDYSRSLFPWLRVGANIEFPLKATHVPSAERKARVQESLEAVGLAGAGNRYPWLLSGGMQQRVAIARVLACRPAPRSCSWTSRSPASTRRPGPTWRTSPWRCATCSASRSCSSPTTSTRASTSPIG